MTMTLNETMTETFTKGDRVRLIDAQGNNNSNAQVGDEGVVIHAGTYIFNQSDGPLVTVQFDSGETTARFARRYELLSTITVEDLAGVKALPVGTELLDRDGDRLVIREDGRADWYSRGNPTQCIGPLADPAYYAPLVVLNPEILGTFAPAPEPLALWEKELLGIFEETEIVEIIGAGADQEIDVEEWAGLRCVVLRGNASSIDSSGCGGDLYLKPLTSRPDAYDMSSFYWPSAGLVRAKAFEVGDLVRVNDGMEYEEGSEGHVTAIESDVEVEVRITVAAGDTSEGEELLYSHGTIDLVQTATQVERDKVRAEEAAAEAERAEQNRVLVAGDRVTRVSQLDLLPAGTVLVFNDDTEAPMTKTYGDLWLRVNRYTDERHMEGGYIAGTVYNQNAQIRDVIELGMDDRQVIVAYVPA